MLPITLCKTSVTAAYTSTAATIVSNLDSTQQPGRAVYRLKVTTVAWVAQGPADFTFTADAASDELTAVAHKLTLGDAVQVSNSGGGLPGGLSVTTTYFAITSDALGSDKFKLATTRALALAGTPLNITSAGTGTHTAAVVATAGAGSHKLLAGESIDIDAAHGAKLSVIRDAADGAATLVQLSVVR
jgi:hypothetical protein